MGAMILSGNESVGSPYTVQLEVSGPLAMFARPDTGASPTSYPVPPWSAAKGLLESIAFFSGGEAWFHPTRVEVCRRTGAPGGAVVFQRYTTNYGGPLRKDLNVSKRDWYASLRNGSR
jgi:CRISPR-associated protein Cas5d